MAPVPTVSRDDPQNEEEIDTAEIPSNNFAMFNESDGEGDNSDMSEDEYGELSGYQPIPQDYTMDDEEMDTNCPNLIDRVLEDTLDSDDYNTSGTDMFNLAEPIDATSEGLNELWNSSRPENHDDVMENDAVETIKSVMSKITLPHSSIPEWAKNISEEDWLDHLQLTRNKSKLMKKV